MKQNSNIGFVGGGNMAASLIGGLTDGGVPADSLRAADPDERRRADLGKRFGIRTEAANTALVEWADTVVLAVKPQKLRAVAENLSPVLQKRTPLTISIAAGIRTQDLLTWANAPIPLVRVMPNTPALVKTGASALFARADVTTEQRQRAEAILAAVGTTLWVRDENELDAVTALSGSGPAYFFLMMEALQNAGESLGLAPDTARGLTLQTALGAARMALAADVPPETLRRQVTSPGGTTERAIETFEDGGFRGLIANAVTAAAERSRTLADTLSRSSLSPKTGE